ncbi:MAG: hypothetical protein LKE54_04420 [Prevotella sp.]|jgi:hypothetical protein|nr:hypothetical protein [Prevotella sp.]MCH3994287.1 hypothetical protein [Prevotella sp.]
MNGEVFESPVKQDDLNKFELSWTREMMTYWREKMMKLSIYRTGTLYRSFIGERFSGHPTTIEHTFAQYGIFVEAGVGKGYTTKEKGNNGDLKFLADHRKHRQRKPWFSTKYYSSVMKLSEVESAFYGLAYQGLMATALENIFENKGIVRNL